MTLTDQQYNEKLAILKEKAKRIKALSSIAQPPMPTKVDIEKVKAEVYKKDEPKAKKPHQEYPIYTCEHCGKTYKTLRWFRIHEANCEKAPDKPIPLGNHQLIITKKKWELVTNALNLALEENAKVKRQLELAKVEICKL